MVPSYENFRDAVYKSFVGSMKMHDQKEVEAYFKSDEAETEMKNQYKSLAKQVKDGEISESVMLGTGAGGVAYCLIMMF